MTDAVPDAAIDAQDSGDMEPVSFDSLSSELLDLSVQVEQAHSECDAVLDELSDAQSVLRSAALRKLMRRLEAVSVMLDAASDAIGEAMASNVALQESYDGPATEDEPCRG